MKYELQRNVDQFIATGNPIYAWWAYRRARQLGEPIPKVVLEYLDNVANAVLAIAAGAPADPKKRPVQLAKGLKLHTSKRFDEYRHDQKRIRFFSLLEDSLLAWIDEDKRSKKGAKQGSKRGWAESELRNIAKQAGIGKSTAEGWFNDYLERERTIANSYLSSDSSE